MAVGCDLAKKKKKGREKNYSVKMNLYHNTTETDQNTTVM